MFGLGWRSLLFFLTGRSGKAFADIAAWEKLQRSHTRYPTTAYHYFRGIYLLQEGRCAEAEQAIEEWREAIDRVLPWSPKRNEGWVRIMLGFIYIRSGRIEKAEEEARILENLSDGIREEVPEAFGFFQDHYSLFRGELLLAQGRHDEAIASLRAAPGTVKPALQDLEIVLHNFPLSRDVLARAYIAKGDLEQAAAEYKRLIYFDPGSNDRRLRNPRYRYRLAKVYEKMGHAEDAKREYEKFLKMWSQAEEGLPQLEDARARLAELKAGIK
jgi:tetratricopeptide (TPR) repeat protein